METRVLMQTLETTTQATGSPSEGTDQIWGLFSFGRPPLTPPGLRFCQKNPSVRSVPSRLLPSVSLRPDRIAPIPPASSRSSPALVAAGVVACLPERTRTSGLDPCSPNRAPASSTGRRPRHVQHRPQASTRPPPASTRAALTAGLDTCSTGCRPRLVTSFSLLLLI